MFRDELRASVLFYDLKGGRMLNLRYKKCVMFLVVAMSGFLPVAESVFATPTTLIWTPSADIQPYKKIHLNLDGYFPVAKRDYTGARVYVLQVYGPTFSLFSDKPDENLLGKIWKPLGKIMAETGFDYKKGLGSVLDQWPWYFHFKLGVPEDAYFKNMPAFAIGAYDMGIKHDRTNYNVWYVRSAKTLKIGELDLGRFSVGYFNGNVSLLRDKNSLRDNFGPMFAWERLMPEISDKLWVCVDYQATQSAYGAMNLGFSWKFTDNVVAILGYDIYNNPNLRNTLTMQFDVDF